MNGERTIAVFGTGMPVDVTDDWPPMPELPTLPQWCPCGNRLTRDGRCSVGYVAHRAAIDKAHAA